MLKKRLKELRLKTGLTLRELGSYIGMAESTVSLYESGKREPDLLTVQKLADCLNVTIDYLLGKSDMPNPEPLEKERRLPKGLEFAFGGEYEELDDEDFEMLKNMADYMVEQKRQREQRNAAKR